MTILLPISALVPTRNRSAPLARTLQSLSQQSVQPVEMIVVDGSEDDQTQNICESEIPGLFTTIKYYRATKIGAATQRNQAISHASQAVIWLMDDDILLEPDCLARLWSALQSDPQISGVNAMITNQRYLPPGRISRSLFRFLHGSLEKSYAGKCIGPALNLLPEDDLNLPEVVPVEWLNTTCTLYRREILPQPLFSSHFTGYSLLEDVTLSLMVGKNWKLANARTARIFHDSQPGDHKNNPAVLAKMNLVNRFFVMTQILERRQPSDYFKLTILQLFEIVASLQSKKGWLSLPLLLAGKLEGVVEILSSKTSN
ncbi:glycosyltransferase family 2 protein [Anabaena cylindrica FACHB-243]|uniref:Glycosyl transferase family 2 n=1 Tax=Anabaena cylindrica (strain ATCC 27899 / PCC 7122) TaxID=272123 RepID=K9ZIX4_ANACC|nr:MULTISPECIES: glycosyltransferase family 2 protein [Anabaena]AFZ59161.1 glycosyl transferase family 2 [Anabaena cylindrica PCC 7122]MBD2416511.1 glycosyltransferase family 2 protein [Anabaena cylindrica FACHB-243]MBY5281083.1 glycosyltransferase family 2 protein [Anabaena sp. CCAP 1446/1C]MBY5309870.1 glycosyltransferase family 2 protein [Anabaena sp. CCAP 1446/1C]MCM2407449.1 glycosyltransferase family 2 protein [Anabaena sp. CCAP 1446/1C]